MKFCVQTNKTEIAQAIIKDFPNCSATLFSDIPWYKFSPKTSSKENGIAFLAQYLNIPTANMISFGASFMKLEDVLKRIDIFLATDFEGGRHERRVNEIE